LQEQIFARGNISRRHQVSSQLSWFCVKYVASNVDFDELKCVVCRPERSLRIRRSPGLPRVALRCRRMSLLSCGYVHQELNSQTSVRRTTTFHPKKSPGIVHSVFSLHSKYSTMNSPESIAFWGSSNLLDSDLLPRLVISSFNPARIE
jgi:hypothetical protein